MQTTHLLGAALVVLGLVACSSGTTGTGAGTGAGTNPLVGTGAGASGGNAGGGNTGAGLAGVAPTAGGAATCDDACAYYLQCKGDGSDTTANRSQCDQNCAALGVTAEQLASYVTLDCQTAITTIEGSAPAPSSSSSGASGGSASTDCNGCSWDGSSCIYLTGSGGNYFACANSCCGH